MLVASFSAPEPRIPRGWDKDTPFLANPLAFKPSPELAAIIRKLSPKSDIEEAWYEYFRLVDDFKSTGIGMRLWKYDEIRDERATGLSAKAWEELDAAYFAWVGSLIDHAALARREHAWLREATKGPQICGHCGGTFDSMAALSSHRGLCSFGLSRGLNIRPWEK
jgi:hypothetical protein